MGSQTVVHDQATKYVCMHAHAHVHTHTQTQTHTHTHTHKHTAHRNEATGLMTQTELVIEFRKECEYCSGNI